MAAIADDLLEIPGFWDKTDLGALHHILPLRCDEVFSQSQPCESLAHSRHLTGAFMLLEPYKKSMVAHSWKEDPEVSRELEDGRNTRISGSGHIVLRFRGNTGKYE